MARWGIDVDKVIVVIWLVKVPTLHAEKELFRSEINVLAFAHLKVDVMRSVHFELGSSNRVFVENCQIVDTSENEMINVLHVGEH